MARQPRVPVRWGFVLMMGVVVIGAVGAAMWYGAGAVSTDSKVKKDAISLVRRALGH